MTQIFAQAGAIPYRITDDRLEVLLISTRSGKHLTTPKGLIDPGLSASETALNEAYEEAGTRGRLLMPDIGNYAYEKWGGICEVRVFVMTVMEQFDRWPEQTMRRRLWIDYRRAALRVKHLDLGKMMLSLPDHLKRTAADQD
ncbi:NUDIX hydrolase [Desulfosarcina sp.]|uniref:NUDIX hydrolase n=1 Tax=Desulfosarcina sp. TaxID=2027861 RepID=UPI0039710AE7